MYVIGLSGGIGSGKTVISDHFASLGVTIIDTDVIARQIVEPGTPGLLGLVGCFGDSILLENGELNRGALRDIAFSSLEKKAQLDAITHPAIHDKTVKQIRSCNTRYCIVVVPLLTAESPFKPLMQRILIVTADEEIKIERVKLRSNLARNEVLRIMNTQLSDDQRLRFADDVIQNNSDLQHVFTEVEYLHNFYSKLSNLS